MLNMTGPVLLDTGIHNHASVLKNDFIVIGTAGKKITVEDITDATRKLRAMSYVKDRSYFNETPVHFVQR
jgi:hypothetical protein